MTRHIRGRGDAESGGGAVAFFIFFAGAAWAGVVAAYFFTSDALRGSGAFSGSHCTGLFQFTFLLALELFLQFVDGGGGRAGVDGDGSVLLAWLREWQRMLSGCVGAQKLRRQHLLGSFDGCAVGADDLHTEEMARGVLLELNHHPLEHFE